MEKNIQHLKLLSRKKRQKKEIKYKQSIEKFKVPQCTTVKELIEEYVQIYGHDK